MTRILPAAIFSLLHIGCSPTGPDLSQLNELRQHREQWQAAQPVTYEFVLQRLCECAPPWSTPLRITVHEGQIRSVENAQTEEPFDVDAEQVESIDDLFALLEQALDGAFRVTAEYDSALGHPTSISIDYVEQMIDDELGFTIRELREVD